MQAFVVPVAAEVAGKVLAVHVRNNDEVQPGQPLFDIDPEPYRIALQAQPLGLRIGAQFGQRLGGRPWKRRAPRCRRREANHDKAEQDASTAREALRGGSRRDIGAPPRDRAGDARSRRAARRRRAEADLRKAQEAAGEAGDDNAQLRSARSAVEKAELDLARTKVVAPARGMVTDLRTDVGHFAQPGAPVMTLIACHDLWISADMTENNLGNIDPGDAVAIVLDVLPGEVLKGRVRSVGGGVSSGQQQAPPGTLPTIQNSRDWLRQAQRFPVAIEFDAAEAAAAGPGAPRRPGRRAGLHRRPSR